MKGDKVKEYIRYYYSIIAIAKGFIKQLPLQERNHNATISDTPAIIPNM